MGTLGDALGSDVGAVRADRATTAAVEDVPLVVFMVAVVVAVVCSVSEDETLIPGGFSAVGVVGREDVVNGGRSKDVKDGDGGSGVGGLL